MQYLHRFFFTLYLFSLFFFLNNNDEAVFIIAILPIYFVYIATCIFLIVIRKGTEKKVSDSVHLSTTGTHIIHNNNMLTLQKH